MRTIRSILTLAFPLVCLCASFDGHAQSTAFTYQGRLIDGASLASGIYDLRFTIYDASGGPGVVVGPVTNSPVAVSNGVFTVALDFGPGVFTGAERWLDIAVRANGGGPFTALTPRQRLAPAPYALFAPTAGTATSAANVAANAVNAAGLQTSAVTSDKIADGTITAADLNAASFAGTFWKMDGNTGTTPGAHFLGTSDDRPLELKVNNTRALRIEPNGNGPNLIAGHPDNVVSNGFARATISGGGGAGILRNKVGGNHATIGGGVANTASGHAATIAGGGTNSASGAYATVSGGDGNLAGGGSSFVGGGRHNSAGGLYATAGGGDSNAADADHATVAGGWVNAAGALYAAVGGGKENTASASSATVAGGDGNTASRTAAFVGGGRHNSAGGLYATVSGGDSNAADADHATVAGGWVNAAGALYAAVGGGKENTASASSATVAGGDGNTASRTAAFVGGGRHNSAGGLYATVGGGDSNAADGDHATVAGGWVNAAGALYASVGGGLGNTASGNYATVPGGHNNFATTRAFAAGQNAQANHAGSFVWSSRTNPAPGFSADRFHVHAQEGLSVDYAAQRPDGGGERWIVLGGFSSFSGETISTWTGARLTDGGMWTDNSDRHAKENFTPVNPCDILERVTALPVQQWNYKTEGADVRHIGPVAQDFYAAFGTGADDKHLAALDSAGVALAAIQGLNEKVECRGQGAETRIQKIEAENAALKTRLVQLEELVRRLAAQDTGGAP